MGEEVVVKVEEVKKTFRVGSQDIEVLKGINFEIFKGDFMVIFGPSGCGKSTLLHTILGLEGPSSGKLMFFNEDIYYGKNEDYRSDFRKKNIGMVYQQANWIKSLNVRENVAFPLLLLGRPKAEAYRKALDSLTSVGMKDWAEYIPTELSGGQQQKISLARALINDPKVIVADEPTGNLDYRSGVEIMELLAILNKQNQKTVVMVTHDLEYLKYATRVVKILDGIIEGIYTGEEKQKVLDSVAKKRGVEEAANVTS